MGCNLARFPRRARMVMIRAMSSRFVHALFCLLRNTCRREAACRAATSLDKKFASFPTITCGNNGWMSGLSHIKATWVRFASPAMPSRVAAQREAPFASWRRCFPSHLTWNKDTEVSSRFLQSGCLPRSTRAARLLYHCHTAWACFLVSGAQKARPFLVSESELKNGLAF